MDEIAISQFKANCPDVIEQVKKTGKPILITRFGQPMAQIVPLEREKRAPRFGTGVGSLPIIGDMVGAISDISDWEAAGASEELIDKKE